MTIQLSGLQKIIYALLGADREPMTGYDMTKFIKTRTGHSHQQVYRECDQMVNMGILKFEKVPQEGKPDKKNYSIAEYAQFEQTPRSDFTKTNGSLWCAIEDACGSNIHNKYIEHMASAERDFIANVLMGEIK